MSYSIKPTKSFKRTKPTQPTQPTKPTRLVKTTQTAAAAALLNAKLQRADKATTHKGAKPAGDAKATPESPIFSFAAVASAASAPLSARERILCAAVEVLNTEGFRSLTQTNVANQAGVRQSHLTYYFPARNDLLRETAAYACNAMLAALANGIDSGLLTLANFRDMLVADIHERRFSRLMCALTAASDEDDHIKAWMTTFEEANRQRLLENFTKLGLHAVLSDIEFFHAAYVGAVILDLAEATPASLARAQHIIQQAFDFVVVASQQRLLLENTHVRFPSQPQPQSQLIPQRHSQNTIKKTARQTVQSRKKAS